MGVDGQRQARPPYPWERLGTHYVEGWVGPRAGLDGYGKSHLSPTGIRSWIV